MCDYLHPVGLLLGVVIVVVAELEDVVTGLEIEDVDVVVLEVLDDPPPPPEEVYDWSTAKSSPLS